MYLEKLWINYFSYFLFDDILFTIICKSYFYMDAYKDMYLV